MRPSAATSGSSGGPAGLGVDFDIVVVGAGPAGASVAAAMARRGIAPAARIALLSERFAGAPAPDADWNLRVFALNRNSQRLLDSIDAWQRIPAARRHPYQRMCVWDATDTARGARALRFDCADLGESDLGHIVDGEALRWAALEAARQAGVVAVQARVTGLSFDERAVRLALDDGRCVRAALVIGADGASSPLRALAGIGTIGHDYHQQAVVAHVRTAAANLDTAWQRFLPGGPLALLPLQDGRSSIVWSVPAARAVELCALAPAEFGRQLEADSDSVLGACTLASGRAAFPLRLQHAQHYVRPRLALVADAAHSVHPLAGQGLNLGLRDVAALCETLAMAPEAIGELAVLRRYERARKADNLAASAAFDGLNRLFGNTHPLLSRLRSAGLLAVERSGPLKRWFARAALDSR
ncbi:MAG: UbiH/UbiF/VisC/COQ6 family ubiquinone biosynthesis hydroxylase [Proteobacteria bacterium]|nr:UbiH/UbiF/VisC/COQ6 family ubiquinone biosynthesis hydroxylase [Pseudomonadota bacterium]